MSTAGREGDDATRQRLLDAATRLFAAEGFQRVTVRSLAREADVNLAAVNYHFGGKLELYREVVGRAFACTEDDVTILTPAGMSAEERLRHYVRTYIPRLIEPKGDGVWFSKLMRHEMTAPTPLAPWIAEQVILPRLRFLSAAVAEMLATDLDDPRVPRCVMSLQSQCLFYLRSPFRDAVFPGRKAMTRTEIEAAVEHVTVFTLAGIGALAG